MKLSTLIKHLVALKVFPPKSSGGLPPGGGVGNVLTKDSTANGAATWKTPNVAGLVDRSSNQSAIAGNKTWTGYQTYSGAGIIVQGGVVDFNAAVNLVLGKNGASSADIGSSAMVTIFTTATGVSETKNVTRTLMNGGERWILNGNSIAHGGTLTLNPVGWTEVVGNPVVGPGEFVHLMAFGVKLYIIHLGTALTP